VKDDLNTHSHDHDELHRLGIEHDHGHAHGHGHTHTHENTKAVLNRLSRAIGHLQSVRRMVEDGRDCTEVLVQVAAVRSAIDNTGKVILQDHLKHCIIDAAREGDQQAIDDLCKAIDKYIK
jgi:DNA-binding FrmR family transcriptional regulator